MKSPEKKIRQQAEEEFANLGGKEKLEIILRLFGSDAARNAFAELCKNYVNLRLSILPESPYGENYLSAERESIPGRAQFHNEIMETLKRLSFQKLNPLEEKILREMASRELAYQIIKDWVLGNEKSEEKPDGKLSKETGRRGQSDTARFHLLGEESEE